MVEARVAAPGRGAGWILEGFGYFTANPFAWIGAYIVLIVLSLALILGLGLTVVLIPILFPAIYIFYPVIIAGFMLGCNEQANGNAFRVGHLFAGFSKNFGQLIKLGVLYLICNIFVMGLMFVLMFFVIGGTEIIALIESGDTEQISSMLEKINEDPTVQILSSLGSLMLTVPLIMAFWFTPALVAIDGVSPMSAMSLSFKACLINVIPFLIYGLIAFIFAILAAIPLGLGYIIFIPMLTASVYISYRDILE